MLAPQISHFGPYNLDLGENVKVQNLYVKINSSIAHLWGENGVGKSTLMNLIIEECTQKKINFAHINQNYRFNWLWWFSLEKNLQLAAKVKTKPELLNLSEVRAQWSWLEPLLNRPKQQVNFQQEEEIAAAGLSGGQLQRLILFRELLRKPTLLLLDEAFSALDKQVTHTLLAWLLEQQQNSHFQIISIAHDEDIVKQLGGQVLVLQRDSQGLLEIHERP